jgi:hypothetical protein
MPVDSCGFGLMGFWELPFYSIALLKLAAVVGGAAGGAWGAGSVARKSAKAVIRREAPRVLVTPFRIVGAVAGGWAIWLLVIGSGFGFGGGDSLFGGSGAGGETSTSNTQTQKVSLPAASPAPTAATAPTAPSTVLRIVVLGGSRVADERFYQVEDNKTPLTLSELKNLINERKLQGLRGLELRIYEDSVAKNHPAVSNLEEWAGKNDLTVSIPPLKGAIP